MARDTGLEEAIRDHLADLPELSGHAMPEHAMSERPMFGGLAWLLEGHLLCAARRDGVLVRLGKGNVEAALALPGVTQMMSRGRAMTGWVWLAIEILGDDDLTRSLLREAVAYVRSLPAK